MAEDFKLSLTHQEAWIVGMVLLQAVDDMDRHAKELANSVLTKIIFQGVDLAENKPTHEDSQVVLQKQDK